MALIPYHANVGALQDSDTSGNTNYYVGEVVDITDLSDVNVSLFSDRDGTVPLPQNGISNVTDAKGAFSFFVAAGSYKVKSLGEEQEFDLKAVDDVILSLTLADAIAKTDAADGVTRVRISDRDNGLFLYLSGQAPNTFDIVATTGNPSLSLVLTHESKINIDAMGADSTGATQNTTVYNRAVVIAKSELLPIVFGGGIYRGSYLIDASLSVRGSGRRLTTLTQDSDNFVVKIFGTGGDNGLGSTLNDLSLDGIDKTGIGLLHGDASGAGASNVDIQRVGIKNFRVGMQFKSAIVCSFKNMWIRDCLDIGIEMESERNVTTCHFDTIRITGCGTGGDFRAGHVITMTNVNFESNININAKFVTGITSGPTNWQLNGCWFEDLLAASPGASLVFDMNPAVELTKPMNLKFNYCTITSPAGELDVQADRAQGVVFDRCNFSVTGGFTSTKFAYNAGTNAVRIKLIQCGQLQDAPSESMYSAFPPLTISSNNQYGIFYEFEDVNGKFFSNTDPTSQGILSISSDATSLDVSGVNTLIVDTSSATIILNSFANGKNGQTIRIVKTSSANDIDIIHNGPGTEKIFTPLSNTLTLSVRSGATITRFNGTWYLTSQ